MTFDKNCKLSYIFSKGIQSIKSSTLIFTRMNVVSSFCLRLDDQNIENEMTIIKHGLWTAGKKLGLSKAYIPLALHLYPAVAWELYFLLT
ncbi:MAG: hypothetical protein MJE68_17020 [Proteobacteria bacterium]|nr:hypothetical protein [Pseudomonadota bacterium]